MADGFLLKKSKNGQVFVILHHDCKISKQEIMELLSNSGVSAELISFLTLEEADSVEKLDNVPIIIPLDITVCDLPELENAARSCGSAGGQVITVFGPNFSYDGLHPIAEKYGNQCGWASDDLATCISGNKSEKPKSSTGDDVGRGKKSQVDC